MTAWWSPSTGQSAPWQAIVEDVLTTWVHPEVALLVRRSLAAPAGRSLDLRVLVEDQPGPVLASLLEESWPAYRRWYLQDGAGARPSLARARAQLEEHMPELVAPWSALVAAAGADDMAAAMLTFVDPPPVVRACSQVAVPAGSGREPALVRNYDWDPALFDGVVLHTNLRRRVVGTADVVWGLLDGVNEDGLAVSLTFGGRPDHGPGFGIPLVVRYLLETCATVDEAIAVLQRLPVHAAYAVAVVDRSGRHATVFVGPGAPARVVDARVSTNHQDRVAWPEHAARYRSVERLDRLVAVLDAPRAAADEDLAERVAASMLEPPVRAQEFDAGFGTLYTAVLRPAEGAITYRWPGQALEVRMDDPVEQRLEVALEPPAWGGAGPGWERWVA
jgi:predicted choloylglycine hydrolase